MTTWTEGGGRLSKRGLFLSTFMFKNVHVVGGGQKRAKLCPRSHWMTPKFIIFVGMIYVTTMAAWVGNFRGCRDAGTEWGGGQGGRKPPFPILAD